MPPVYQIAQVSCAGGLDLRSNTQELLRRPGYATVLQNFEQSISGGYRRINGYSELGGGSAAVPGTGEILGTAIYAGGYIVCRGDAIYFSFAGAISWIQVNKDQGTLADLSTLNSAAALPRSNADHYTFNEYTPGTGETQLLIREANNKMALLTITGTSSSDIMVSYKEISSGSIAGATYGEILKNQHVAAGNPSAPASIYVSAIAAVDDFVGTNSQEISVAEPITGLKVFRENLYIFCEQSIWRASNLDDTSQTVVQNVTRNVGCIDGNTIQEIGGDLVFLSHDGFRTLAGTDRIDDVNVSTISLDINNETLRILQNRNQFDFRSVVLKERSQYRLFYSRSDRSVSLQEGIIATFYPNPETGQSWSFSQTLGIEVTSIGTGYHNGLQVTIHGDYSGRVYLHDSGSNFNGSSINAVYQTPSFDLGDSGLRKNYRELITYIAPEGNVNLVAEIVYDFQSPEVHQPDPFTLSQLSAPSLYGQVNYGEFVYGAPELPIRIVQIQGSGFTSYIRFETSGTTDPFTIQGYDINFTTSGRI